MIGAYAIDASMVYSMNKYHEMYRAWVPLMDDEDPDDVGVQGYLKISIQVRAACWEDAWGVSVLIFYWYICTHVCVDCGTWREAPHSR